MSPGRQSVSSNPLNRSQPPAGYRILIHENAVIQQLMEAAEIESEARRIFAEDLKQEPKAWDAKKTTKGKGKKAEPEAGEAKAPDEVSPADDAKDGPHSLRFCRRSSTCGPSGVCCQPKVP